MISSKLVLKENFTDNQNKWEIVNLPTEMSEIKDGHYWMSNLSDTSWHHYSLKFPLNFFESWMLEAEVELLYHEDQMNYGLVWGFNKQMDQYCRFTISADGNSCSVVHFDRNYDRVFHRYRRNFKNTLKGKIKLGIARRNEYYHFYVNDHLVYITHGYHLCQIAEKFGFYVEPGLCIRSAGISMYKLPVEKGSTI